MIKTWRHKGIKRLFETGSTAGIQAKHAEDLKQLLFQLANAIKPEDMNTPGNDFHKLSGNLKGYYAVKVSKNWRLMFGFQEQDAVDVDLIDYH